MNLRLAPFVVAAAWALIAAGSSAATTHVVGPGHTLAKIARRYHTSVEALRDANNLVAGQKLRLGQRIVIPDADRQAMASRASTAPGAAKDVELDSVRERKGASSASSSRTDRFAVRVRNAGVVTLVRGSEQWIGKTRERSGRVAASAAEGFRRLLRDHESNDSRAIDPRLVTAITAVSDHFGGRSIEIVSGYRPHSQAQHTAHSNHNIGRAVDFVVRGVPNETLRDFCRTLHDVGVGYYPNSSFIHLDVRSVTTYWVDESGPGELPRYTSISNQQPDQDISSDSKDTKSKGKASSADSPNSRQN
jgi:uncharacterized protein YcbK (DUF882 family)